MLRDIDKKLLELFDKAISDPDCAGIVLGKGRRRPDEEFSQRVYLVRHSLMQKKDVHFITQNKSSVVRLFDTLTTCFGMKIKLKAIWMEDRKSDFDWDLYQIPDFPGKKILNGYIIHFKK